MRAVPAECVLVLVECVLSRRNVLVNLYIALVPYILYGGTIQNIGY